jgi:hypothetical protein
MFKSRKKNRQDMQEGDKKFSEDISHKVLKQKKKKKHFKKSLNRQENTIKAIYRNWVFTVDWIYLAPDSI